MTNTQSSIYRGMKIYHGSESCGDDLWRWTDPNGVAACTEPFKTETDAMNDVDRFKRKQRSSQQQS